MRKRIPALVLAALLVCAISGTASAASLVPSATVATAPSVSGATASDGTVIPSGDISVTAVQDAGSLSAAASTELQEAYREINSAGSVRAFLDNAGLTSAVETALAGTSATASDMAVQSVFDVSASGAAAEVLAANGSVDITFSVPGVQAGSAVVVLHYNGSGWDVRPSTCANGVVTATFTSLSPVVIMVEDTAAVTAGNGTVTSPQTSDMNLEGVLICGSLLCAAALAYCLKRRQTA